MLKLFGQVLFVATLAQLFPTDAMVLEQQLGIIDQTHNAPIVETGSFSTLPLADTRNMPVKVDFDSHGIVTTAWSALVVDHASSAVLFQKNPNQLRSIGSVTKLMTAMVFLEQDPDLDQMASLDPELDYVEGGRVYLGYFNALPLRDVLAASLVGSDNTATQALVRFSGLTMEEFVQKMNEKAQNLGMSQTVFHDVTGLSAYNMSTARELVLLLKAAEQNNIIRDDTQQPSITITQVSGRSVVIKNTNTLLSSFINEDPYTIVGGKTGYLPQAGYVLATTVEYEGNRVHVLVMGAESKEARINEAKGLAFWAFKTYEWPE